MYWHCRKRIPIEVRQFAWPFLFQLALAETSEIGTIMSESHSKSRQQAELAFGKAQSQFFARNRAVDEHAFVAQARDEKTQRLREARLAKEQEDRARATAALLSKRGARP